MAKAGAAHHRVRGLTLAIGLRPHWPTLATPIGRRRYMAKRGAGLSTSPA